MAKQATELMYAVRFRVVFKYFGQLCLVLAVLTCRRIRNYKQNSSVGNRRTDLERQPSALVY